MQTQSAQVSRSAAEPAVSSREIGAGVQIRVAEDYEAMSRDAAARIVAELRQQPEAVLCLATGESPTRTYELLAAEG